MRHLTLSKQRCPPWRISGIFPNQRLKCCGGLLLFFLRDRIRAYSIGEAEADRDKDAEAKDKSKKRIDASLSHNLHIIQHIKRGAPAKRARLFFVLVFLNATHAGLLVEAGLDVFIATFAHDNNAHERLMHVFSVRRFLDLWLRCNFFHTKVTPADRCLVSARRLESSFLKNPRFLLRTHNILKTRFRQMQLKNRNCFYFNRVLPSYQILMVSKLKSPRPGVV